MHFYSLHVSSWCLSLLLEPHLKQCIRAHTIRRLSGLHNNTWQDLHIWKPKDLNQWYQCVPYVQCSLCECVFWLFWLLRAGHTVAYKYKYKHTWWGHLYNLLESGPVLTNQPAAGWAVTVTLISFVGGNVRGKVRFYWGGCHRKDTLG